MFCLRRLIQLRQSWRNSLSIHTRLATAAFVKGSDQLRMHKKCPPNYFAAILCTVFLCFLWPPITHHRWQTPQRFHAASLHSETEFHPVCRLLGLQTLCSIRLLCSSRSLMFLCLAASALLIWRVFLLFNLLSVLSLCVLSIKCLIFSWWVLQHLYCILH